MVFPILHHLYKNIPDVVILPISLEKQFRNHIISLNKAEAELNAQDLKKSLQDEINLVGEFLERYRIHVDNSEDVNATDTKILESYRKFRCELNEHELKSDLLYSTLKNCVIDDDVNIVDSSSDISL